MKTKLIASLLALTTTLSLKADRILIETESFSDHGGWKLDTQFIREMGSPYLLAHGLGTPVQDATTTIEVKEGGNYQLFARTKDWVARWSQGNRPLSNHHQRNPGKINLRHQGSSVGLKEEGKLALKKERIRRLFVT